MKTEAFQNLLLNSAVSVMACDGSIDESEIAEIKKQNGKKAINEYLNELSQLNLNEKQELLLIEVLIRTIESDNKIEDSEVKFLQMVKSKLGISEETIITQFPKQMKYLIDFQNYGLHEEFTDEIEFASDN
jgi:uncharacterized tellurite resistance protein B-like protein